MLLLSQKIRTIDLDAKTIKLQIVSATFPFAERELRILLIPSVFFSRSGTLLAKSASEPSLPVTTEVRTESSWCMIPQTWKALTT
jgi:hypothetical protein